MREAEPRGAGRRVASALVAAGLVAGAVWILVSGSRPEEPIQPGKPAPGFSLPALRGERSVSLESLRGHVVLVNFWATWCGPCEREMPAMERLYRELGDRDFELLAVSVDRDREAVRAFRERLGLSFPILLDPEKRAASAYQTHRYPESYLIDRDGTLVARYVGPREWDAEAYVRRIRRLLDAPGDAS